ncbi:hypothetical protein QWZ16_15275 [Vibrio ostreicida]|nr:hypothetical protein [Vibrio ostreicida]MDN3611035.1 hypothetical protein [Vibrio ostreicida]
MGSDTISNTLYALLDKMGVNDDNAEYWARATSTTLRLGLTIGTLFSGMVSPANVPGALGSAMSTIKIAKLGVGAAGNSALSFQLDNTSKAKSKVGQDLKNHQEAMTTSQLDKTKEQLSRTTTNLDRERTFSDILARKNEQVFNQLERAQHAIEQKDKAILELTEKLKLFIQSGVSGPEIQQLASEHFT